MNSLALCGLVEGQFWFPKHEESNVKLVHNLSQEVMVIKNLKNGYKDNIVPSNKERQVRASLQSQQQESKQDSQQQQPNQQLG